MPKMSERLRVLLLSDKEETTGLFRETLAAHLDVATARDSEELFSLLQSSSFDAFLCDWDCPEYTWREICREVKGSHPDLPIIVVCRMCRSGGEREWVEVLEAGCFDLACAPYSVRMILSIIEHAVASRLGCVLKSVA